MDRLEALAAELGSGQEAVVKTDVKDREQVKALVDQAVRTHGRADIGGVKRYSGDGAAKDAPFQDSAVTSLTGKYGKTPAQIVLRWQIELGHSIIPKSVHPGRIRESGDVFDFELTGDEIAAINAIDRGERGGPDPAEVTPQMFDFRIED